MLHRKKKPVQYFFVDINDPDYYKRIKVARACVDCRKRKSKCDIGKPGTGPCSSCRKHNKICEFASSTVIPSPASTLPSCLQILPSTSEFEYLQPQLQPTQQCQRRRAPMVRRHTRPSLVSVIDKKVASDPEQIIHSSRVQSSATKGQTPFVGRLQIDLPVLCLQQENSELPITPPLSLSSHSVETTPSPPLHTDYADGYMYPEYTTDETLPSIPMAGPIEIKHQSSLVSSLELDLFHLYLECIHATLPVLSTSILKLRNPAPLCLKYAILSLSSLYYYNQQQPSMMYLSQEYYSKACDYLNTRGTNDLTSAQTLLLLYKYHEALGQPNESLLERVSSILEQYSRIIDTADSYQSEWLYRLQWIVYLCHFNASSTLNGTWRDPPMIRLPSLLPFEQHDQDQVKAITQLLDTIHTANIYTCAMQSLCIPADDHWTFGYRWDPPSL